MIFDQCLGFLDEFSVDVEVFTLSGTVVGNGTLTVKKNNSPQVNFDFRIDISKFTKHKSFICKSEKYTYHLLSCDVLDTAIIPMLLARGKKSRSTFKKINLLFQGLSQWMDPDGKFELTENEVIKYRGNKTFNTEVEHCKGLFTLCNEYWCETKHVGANNYQINEYTALTIKAKNFSWSVSELYAVISEIQTFFTLLLGHSIGLKYVLDASDKNTTQSLYFPNYTSDASKEILPRKCFVRSCLLFKENRWKDLLQGYFSDRNEKYRNIWSRMSGMLSYEGFWEYRILAYVSLVDRYVSIYTEDKKKSLSKNQFQKYRRAARTTLENIKSECVTEESQRGVFDAVIESMCQQITQNIKNTSISSFNEKFELKLKDTNKNIIEILDFSDADFDDLKKIRDCVAHGDEPAIKSGGDITHEVTITNKLALLLRYWTFMDIGFSHSDFIVFLSNWMYPITQQACINKTALDIASGNYCFLEVNKKNFNVVKNHKFGYIVLDYVKTSDTIRVNTSATNHISCWYSDPNKKHRSVDEELIEIVDISKVKSIAYLNNLYLKYEDEPLYISTGAYILNCPEYISSNQQVKDHLRVFDAATSVWLPSEFQRRVNKKAEAL